MDKDQRQTFDPIQKCTSYILNARNNVYQFLLPVWKATLVPLLSSAQSAMSPTPEEDSKEKTNE